MARLRLFAALVSLALLLPARASASYPWPFKPFDKQHPIRGFFGDPRTVYLNGILAGGFDGPGAFSFHQGIDISAPDGTPIYAIANGTAHYLGASTLNVVTGGGVTFQYFHIVSVVGEGQHVIARETVLGYVEPPFGHVHISEIDGTRIVNPLQRGHLAPYRDTTRPTIREIIVRDASGAAQSPLGLCGRVELDADVFDTPPVAVPGEFRGMPVAPAFVGWELTRLAGGVVSPWRAVADFRKTLPSSTAFWSVYAKGTYQNAPRFGREQYDSMPGRYLFLLSGNFDTTSLSNGVYVISVRAADIRGNRTLSRQRISVLNAHGGSCPGSLPAPPEAPPPAEPPADATTP
jgi:peptidase M23-like protein